MLVAPCCWPSLDAVPPQLLSLCGNPGGEPELEVALRRHNWLVHGTWHGASLRIAQPVAGLELGPPQVWQRADLESGTTATDGPKPLLRWELGSVRGPVSKKGRELAGFLFSSRFLFRDSADTLDARRQPTHWGTLFVPWDFGSGGDSSFEQPSAVELSTTVDDPSRPACFELRASMATGELGAACGEGHRCAASQHSGELASEHFA